MALSVILESRQISDYFPNMSTVIHYIFCHTDQVAMRRFAVKTLKEILHIIIIILKEEKVIRENRRDPF